MIKFLNKVLELLGLVKYENIKERGINCVASICVIKTMKRMSIFKSDKYVVSFDLVNNLPVLKEVADQYNKIEPIELIFDRREEAGMVEEDDEYKPINNMGGLYRCINNNKVLQPLRDEIEHRMMTFYCSKLPEKSFSDFIGVTKIGTMFNIGEGAFKLLKNVNGKVDKDSTEDIKTFFKALDAAKDEKDRDEVITNCILKKHGANHFDEFVTEMKAAKDQKAKDDIIEKYNKAENLIETTNTVNLSMVDQLKDNTEDQSAKHSEGFLNSLGGVEEFQAFLKAFDAAKDEKDKDEVIAKYCEAEGLDIPKNNEHFKEFLKDIGNYSKAVGMPEDESVKESVKDKE